MVAFARCGLWAGPKKSDARSRTCWCDILRGCTQSRCARGCEVSRAMRRADRPAQFICGALLPLSAGCYPDDVLATRLEPAAGEAACLAEQVQAISSSSHSRCPELAAPTGPIICVGPEQADQLVEIVREAPSGASIVLLDGSYRMTGDQAARSLAFDTPGVTMRSASGRAEQVILDGEYLTDEMIRITAS